MSSSAGRRNAHVRRLPRLAALGFLLAAAAVLFTPGRAFAHAELESTTPANGAVLAQSPPSVTLHFGEGVESSLGSVQVYDAAEHRVDSGDTHHPDGRGSEVAVSLKPNLPDGTYLVSWRVVSADSHPVSGAFVFSVGKPGAVPKDIAAQGSKAVSVTLGVARFLGFAGLALLLGGALFITLCWPAGANDLRARRLLAVGWWTAVIATLAALFLEGPYGAGLGLGSVFDGSTLHATVHTRFGEAHVYRLLFLLMFAGIAVAAGRAMREGERPAVLMWVASASVGLAALATVAVAGHAADGSDRWLAVPVDVAHLTAMIAWVGGLATLAVCLLFRREAVPDLRASLPRFSQVALVSVLVLIASGTYASWRDLGAWGALTGTRQGKVLLVKLAVIVILLGAAALSRRWLRSRTRKQSPQRWEELRQLRRSVATETTLAAVVLAVTAVLVAAPPGKTAWRPTSSFDLTAGPVRVQLSVVPLGPNRLDVHAYTFNRAGTPRDVAELTATASDPDRHVAGLPVKFADAGPGHFVADGVTFPGSGRWTLELHVRTNEIDEYMATATLTVR